MMIKKDQLTPHFRLLEFACGGEMIITPEFISFVTRVLEPFRVWYNRPININSGYRTVAKNNQLPGHSPTSLHLRAMAVDTNLPVDYLKGTPDQQREFFDHVRSMWNSMCRAAGGYGQICWYDTYMHLGMSWEREYFEDKRGKREWIM